MPWVSLQCLAEAGLGLEGKAQREERALYEAQIYELGKLVML